MSSTHLSLHYHLVFGTKNRELVPEVPRAGEDHRHVASVGGGNDFVVAD